MKVVLTISPGLVATPALSTVASPPRGTNSMVRVSAWSHTSDCSLP